MKKIGLLIFVVLFNILNAQSLNLKQCINKALISHPDIKQFALTVGHSEKGVDVARADYLPQVTLHAEYDPIKTYALPVNGVFNTKNSDAWMTGITVNQKIWDFSKTTSNIKAQKVQQEISKLSLQDAKALLAYKVKLQYELIFVQKLAIQVRERDVNAKEELYKQAEALLKQGMKTIADTSRFLSAVYAAKDNLAVAQANFDKARTSLSLYINEPIDKDVILNDTISNNYGQEKKENIILEKTPSLTALKKNITKNEFAYSAAKASQYGSLDAVVSYNRQNSLNAYDSTFVGIAFNAPLYSGGKINALVEQANINKQNAQEAYNSKALALKEEFEHLQIDLKRYEHTIEAKKSQLQASEKTMLLLNARYKEGVATYIEVLDATALRLNAELGLLQAKYERSSTFYRLEYLQGKTI